MVLYGEPQQEYPVNTAVPQGSTSGATFSYYTSVTIYADNTTFYSKYDQTSDNQRWLLNLSMTYEKLWTVTESGLVISMLEKLILFYFTGLTALVLLM